MTANYMRIRALTKDQQITNCILALCNWRDVAPKTVFLEIWVCGTFACFGGHLATWPEFKEMGVRACSASGVPEMSLPSLYGMQVAGHLFGCQSLFSNRRSGETSKGSAHKLIVRRLENQIAKLSS